MSAVNGWRLAGRMEAVPGLLMNKYGLSLTREESDLKVLLAALGMKVQGEDGHLCMRLVSNYDGIMQRAAYDTRGMTNEEVEAEKAKGREEAAFLFGKYPNAYASKLLADTDFLVEKEQDRLRKKAKMRKIGIACACAAAALIIGICIYNLPYFAEKRAFHRVEKYFAQEQLWDGRQEAMRYQREYPQGKHIDDVLMMPVKFYYADDNMIDALESAEDYLKARPDGSNAAECHRIIDEIWQGEIDRYKKSTEGKAGGAGVDFVVKMLEYMQKENVRVVNVEINPTLDLKEYSEYSYEVRTLLEALQDAGGPRLPGDMVTIKDKITKKEAVGWGKYIIDGLNKGFDKVLTHGFIKFRNVSATKDTDTADEDAESAPNAPKAVVDFTVKTQEAYENVPDIWVYTQRNGTLTMSSSLLVGIAMDFKADFLLPQENVDYAITAKGDPGEAQIEADPSQGYTIMCERCTEQFADKIATEFGLPIPE